MKVMKEVCNPKVVAFVEKTLETKDDLKSRLMELAPESSDFTSQMILIKTQIAKLKEEEMQWNQIMNQEDTQNIQFEPINQPTTPILTEEQVQCLSHTKQKLILQVRCRLR